MQEPARPHQISPWHEGERAAQKLAGVDERMEEIGKRVIRPFMLDQHRMFFAGLPFVLVGSVDQKGWPWASILSGGPGFLQSPDPVTLDVAARPRSGDPLSHSLQLGTRLGMLGIELSTRRRNRVNGEIIRVEESGFSLHVEQSFGNCPKYIQPRRNTGRISAAEEAFSGKADNLTGLDERARALITQADTFFVASHAPAKAGLPQSADVSHRGGPAGFLRLSEDDAITIPDYPGNLFFNTLGNLMLNPRAGLLFVDFERGDLLQITGDTEIAWNEKAWRFKPLHGRWLNGGLPMRFVRIAS
ncbi:MAG: pyridoxamine 5'-phosphate oxidase family protein [Hyphomicrobiales bacterium]|nr:pyridoxamine 5'-phosphate oxidase family protein [Hyphomicrobiales bacterium]